MFKGRDRETYIYDNPEIFSIRLRKALEEKDVTQAELALDSIASRNTLSRYVTGVGTPTVPVLQSICRALDVSADYLIGLSNKMDLAKSWVQKDKGYFCPYCDSKGESWYSYCPMCGKEIFIEI